MADNDPGVPGGEPRGTSARLLETDRTWLCDWCEETFTGLGGFVVGQLTCPSCWEDLQ